MLDPGVPALKLVFSFVSGAAVRCFKLNELPSVALRARVHIWPARSTNVAFKTKEPVRICFCGDLRMRNLKFLHIGRWQYGSGYGYQTQHRKSALPVWRLTSHRFPSGREQLAAMQQTGFHLHEIIHWNLFPLPLTRSSRPLYYLCTIRRGDAIDYAARVCGEKGAGQETRFHRCIISKQPCGLGRTDTAV